jgi:hypothetical protein
VNEPTKARSRPRGWPLVAIVLVVVVIAVGFLLIMVDDNDTASTTRPQQLRTSEALFDAVRHSVEIETLHSLPSAKYTMNVKCTNVHTPIDLVLEIPNEAPSAHDIGTLLQRHGWTIVKNDRKHDQSRTYDKTYPHERSTASAHVTAAQGATYIVISRDDAHECNPDPGD